MPSSNPIVTSRTFPVRFSALGRQKPSTWRLVPSLPVLTGNLCRHTPKPAFPIGSLAFIRRSSANLNGVAGNVNGRVLSQSINLDSLTSNTVASFIGPAIPAGSASFGIGSTAYLCINPAFKGRLPENPSSEITPLA